LLNDGIFIVTRKRIVNPCVQSEDAARFAVLRHDPVLSAVRPKALNSVSTKVILISMEQIPSSSLYATQGCLMAMKTMPNYALYRQGRPDA